MPHVMLITNYGAVLALVALMGRVTARQIAGELGVTERTVLRIIAQLERGGYLRRERVGRVNSYHVSMQLDFGALGDQGKALKSFVQWMLSGAERNPPVQTGPSGDQGESGEFAQGGEAR